MSTEIERFARKAADYKAALGLAPHARALEAIYLLGIIDGFTKANNLEREEVVILDLMAGSGFMSDALYRSGYRKLHAVEVCHEMSKGVSIYEENVTLHTVSSIFDIRPVIQDIDPIAIVSLASFHHLIVKSDTGSVNRDGSIALQEHLYNLCIENLTSGGLLLIADIYENSIYECLNPGTTLWSSTRLSRKMIPENPFNNLRHIVGKARTLQHLTRKLNEITGMNERSNPALPWFRNVVDENTSIGHDDIALSREFIERISKNRKIDLDIISCPWLFQTDYELKNFITKKFGFAIDQDNRRLSEAELFDRANSVVGIKKMEDALLFNWRLAAISQTIPLNEDIRSIRPSSIWLLILLNILIGALIVLKLCWLIDVKSEPGDWIQYILFSVLGILVGRVFDWIGKQHR